MKIQLSDHFTYKRLIRFVFPSIIMMICTSMYSIIDGLFISNFAGKTAFAAVNLILPVAMGVGAIGFMIGSGGSAIVAKTLGEGKEEKANEYFSILIFTALIGATILSIFGFIFIRLICIVLGARGHFFVFDLFLKNKKKKNLVRVYSCLNMRLLMDVLCLYHSQCL